MMKLMKQQRSSVLISLIMAVFLLFAFPSYGEEEVIRVGYPIQEGLTEKDENGNYSGYTYEYLQEVAQYTGWNYEFVEVPGTGDEQLTTLLTMLEQGKIDLMGSILYSEELDATYDYSGHSHGIVETVLQVLQDDVQDTMINSQATQYMTIAVLEKSKVRMKELEEYCRMNLIVPQFEYCKNEEELVAALKEGRAQMLLNTSLNPIEGMRTIARFAPKPFYFITSDGDNHGLIKRLNTALVNIDQTDPYFTGILQEKYFYPNQHDLFFTLEEEKFIKETPLVRMGVLTDMPPFQVEGGKRREMGGISIDIARHISERTGLELELVPAESVNELDRMIQAGEIDMIAEMSYDYEYANERDLVMTRPYISAPYILMMNTGLKADKLDGKRPAAIATSYYYGDIYQELGSEIAIYDTVSKCIEAVNRGDADYTYVDSYEAQYYINQPRFRTLQMLPQTAKPRKISFGIAEGHTQLLGIFNKGILNITEEEMQTILYSNTLNTPDFSLSYLVRKYPVEIIAGVAAVLICIIGLLLLLLYQRIRMNRNMTVELNKRLRVYELMDEYFFEYDYQTRMLVISSPKKNVGGQPRMEQYDFSKTAKTPEEEKRRSMFLDVMKPSEEPVQEVLLYCMDEKWHWLRIATDTAYDPSGKPSYCIGKFVLIDHEKEEMDQLIAQAQRDGLTGILNGETCRVQISESLNAQGKTETGAFILIDLDYFKAVNDTYGHLRGDAALRDIAKLLTECFRLDDVIGRSGGDEFLVYMRNPVSREILEAKCKLLCEKANEIQIADEGYLSLSVGATLTYGGQLYETVYQLADQALYIAKMRGRDQYAIEEYSSGRD